ncbi:hypothetical protein JCGZ_20977 [Jatropha curcas]|uniref:E3 ubiquitin-protein ligase RMA n=1 Tax=Jatropha curcas TaxID=180498 RepID=A0A067JT22_JATCU|nr:E3 ubiquitin-protein ligase RMA3 [Jatropha curcas]KDP27042.1 hypothetical protein JCGZ_20977 [Jatropha curcas]
MPMEPNFFAPQVHVESEDSKCKQHQKSVSSPTGMSGDNGDCFDCNICLDSAQDPVVTFCGHLYCWPCIYKWLNVKSSSLDADEEQPKCPVCKANISPNSLVPLYGRGTSRTDSGSKKPSLDVVIPRRPLPALNSLITSQNQQLHPNFVQSQSQPHTFHQQQYFPNPYRGYGAMASSNIGGAAMTQIFNPMIGMFGELIFARIFGTSDTSLFAYSYPNSNPLMGTYNQRMRRHEMQLEKSLNRVTIFLLCCIILCLLLF